MPTCAGLETWCSSRQRCPDRGTHHVNEQWPSYWIPRFEVEGFEALRLSASAALGRCRRCLVVCAESLRIRPAGAAERFSRGPGRGPPLAYGPGASTRLRPGHGALPDVSPNAARSGPGPAALPAEGLDRPALTQDAPPAQRRACAPRAAGVAGVAGLRDWGTGSNGGVPAARSFPAAPGCSPTTSQTPAPRATAIAVRLTHSIRMSGL